MSAIDKDREIDKKNDINRYDIRYDISRYIYIHIYIYIYKLADRCRG